MIQHKTATRCRILVFLALRRSATIYAQNRQSIERGGSEVLISTPDVIFTPPPDCSEMELVEALLQSVAVEQSDHHHQWISSADSPGDLN